MSSEPRPTLLESVRRTPRTAWALYAGTFVNRFGTFVVPFLILYLTRKGYSATQAGLAVTTYGAGGILAAGAGGHMADRIGRRNTVAISMFSSAAAMLLLSQAEHLPTILSLAFVAGLAAELYRPASSAMVADLIPPERRVTGYAMYRLAVNAGWAAGPAVAGFLAHRSFFLVFLGDALTSLALGVTALVAFPHGPRTTKQEERERAARGERSGFRAVFADRRFRLYLASVFCVASVYMQSVTTLPLHVKHVGLSIEVFGVLLSLNGALVVFVELPVSGFTQRLPIGRVIAFGSLLVGFGMLLNTFAQAVPLLVVSVVVWTLGEVIGAPVGVAYVANLAPDHLRGRYQAANGLMWGLAAVVGPIAGTLVYAWSPSTLWLGCGLLGLASAALVTASVRGHRTDVPLE